MTRREKERKIKMFGMIGMSVLVIASLATSTYAWYVSRNKATVNTTELVVDAGLQYKFYAFNGNFKDGNPANAVTGYTSASPTGTFASNFTEITSASQTTFSQMWPGEKLTFAVHVYAISKTKINLSVSQFASQMTGDHIFAVKKDDKGNVSTGPIDMAWAMNLYGHQSANNAYFTQFIEGYLPYDSSAETPVKTPLSNKLPVEIGTVVSSEVHQTPFTLAESTLANKEIRTGAGGIKETYLFYTVEFSDEPKTWYRETNADASASYPYHGTSSIKYYVLDPKNGNSSCYEGLTFSVSRLTISEGDQS